MVSSDSEARPVIGISTYVEHASWGVWEREATLLPRLYPDAVTRAGGVPVLLPPAVECSERVLDALDGLVTSGGPDVDPQLYGAETNAHTSVGSAERDSWELALTHGALERDLPLLAICRGAHLLNVATGGSLQQHQPDIVGHQGHRPAAGVFGTITVRLEADSLTGSILGSETKVDCHHHQAFDGVGTGLRVVGRAEDGGVEAVEFPGRGFAVGVQWHPEEDRSDTRLFTALVNASAASRLHTRREGTR